MYQMSSILHATSQDSIADRQTRIEARIIQFFGCLMAIGLAIIICAVAIFH